MIPMVVPRINAYVRFNGNCREAMEFYRRALGGDLTLMTAGESSMAKQVPAEAQGKIVHSTLASGDLLLHGSDTFDGGEPAKGGAVALDMECDSEKELRESSSKLSAGGRVTLPVSQQFWGAVYGQLTDRFGIGWMLNFQKPSEQQDGAPGQASPA